MSNNYEFIAATFTPMNSHGEIDIDSIGPYVDFLAEGNLNGAFINGTTGESLSLTTDERLQVADKWLEVGHPRLKIMVHVGHNCVQEAAQLARHANDRGAAAIGCMAPCFLLPRNVDELIDYLEPVAAAAPDTDFYFYHFPTLTGVQLVMEEFIPQAALRIKTFAGIKYTHEDLNEFQRCIARWGEQYQFYFGRDELLLPALSVGARGGVGSIYGLVPRAFGALAASYFEDDIEGARHVSGQINQFIETLKDVGVIPGGKAFLGHLGIGNGTVRLPLKTLAPESLGAVVQAACNLLPENQKLEDGIVSLSS